MQTSRVHEVRPRKDKRGIDLISDALPFGAFGVIGTSRCERNRVRNLFCFPDLGFRVCLPYRHRRECSPPKPGKKKQKRYDYGHAILIIHSFLE